MCVDMGCNIVILFIYLVQISQTHFEFLKFVLVICLLNVDCTQSCSNWRQIELKNLTALTSLLVKRIVLNSDRYFTIINDFFQIAERVSQMLDSYLYKFVGSSYMLFSEVVVYLEVLATIDNHFVIVLEPTHNTSDLLWFNCSPCIRIQIDTFQKSSFI